MGWFEEQVKKRKKLDEQTFEDSFLSLAGLGKDHKKSVSEQALRENDAISHILTYYHVPMVDIPSSVVVFKERLNFALRPYDILYHEIELSASWEEDNYAPLLAFVKANHAPVVLLPKGNKGYFYFHYQTGKKIKASSDILEKLEPNVYRFFRPLPKMKASLKEYVHYLRRSMRPLETVIFALFAAITLGAGLAMPYLTKMLTGLAVPGQDLGVFALTVVYVVSAATGLLLAKAIQNYISNRISIKREKAVREATMMRMLSLPPSFFKKYNTGELTSRFNSVPLLASTIFTGMFTALASLVMSVAYLLQMGSFTPILIFPVIVILLASTGFTVIVAVTQKNYTRKVLELSSKESGVTYETINGIQKIRLSGSEKRVFAKWAKVYSRSARTRYRPPLILKLSPAITLLITTLGTIVLYFIAAKNAIAVPDYMAFVTSYGVLSGAFASLGQVVGVLASIEPLFEMARPILNAEPETNQGKTALESIGGNIHFENVTFRYLENGPAILKNLTLDIHEGEYIAIVGKTGCGKSTFVRLLLGSEKPNEGNISYDGIPMDVIDLPSLRRHIGTVMQNGTLFHADILSNIIVSAPNLTEEDAWHAAEIADIASDIRKMPMKMKTVISEGQGGISGGQKQRIMIARAIVHQPKVLIFDEATSALDNKTQKSISDSIAKLNCTRIVIAHRLSTIQNADRILMLENGQVVESGDYETLIQNHGKFAELVERQRIDNKA